MIKLFRSLTKKDMFLMCLTFILIVIHVYLELRLPEYMSEMTLLIQTGAIVLNDILSVGVKMLLVAFSSLLVSACIVYCTSYIAANFSYNTRKKIFQKVESFSMNEIKKFKTSSLITRTTNDVNQVEVFIVMGLQLLFKAPIMAIWAVVTVGLPSSSQVFQSLLVAISSGVIATTLFFIATDRARHNQGKLAAVEATQSTEVLFVIVGEMLLLGVVMPTSLAFVGVGIIIIGMLLHSYYTMITAKKMHLTNVKESS